MNKKGRVKYLFKKLDSYLLGDIEAMLEGRPDNSGGIGYPCLVTILTGMELLGILISGEKKKKAFNAFWEVLGQRNSQYKSVELRDLFRSTIRNGVAHYYLPKYGIYVHYKKPEIHLQQGVFHGQKGIGISCSALYSDFLEVYKDIKRELLNKPDSSYLGVLENDMDKGYMLVEKYLESENFKITDDGEVVSFDTLAGASGIKRAYTDGELVDPKDFSA
jgi:hypothetical protein